MSAERGRVRRRAKGLCYRCSNKAIEGKSQCKECGIKKAEYERKMRNLTPKEKQQRIRTKINRRIK